MDENKNEVEIEEIQKWYQKTWVIVLALIFLAPVGLIMMWYQRKFSKPVRIVVTLLLTPLILANLLDKSSDPEVSNKPTTAKVEKIEIPKVKEKTQAEIAVEAAKEKSEAEAKRNVELKAQAELKAVLKAEEARFKKESKNIPYTKLARDPDKYFTTKVVYNGKVVQVMEEGNAVALRVNITKGRYGSWDDTVLVIYERKEGQGRILDNDIIKFWGLSKGLETYTTVLGAEMTIPKIEAKYLSVIGIQK